MEKLLYGKPSPAFCQDFGGTGKFNHLFGGKANLNTDDQLCLWILYRKGKVKTNTEGHSESKEVGPLYIADFTSEYRIFQNLRSQEAFFAQIYRVLFHDGIPDGGNSNYCHGQVPLCLSKEAIRSLCCFLLPIHNCYLSSLCFGMVLSSTRTCTFN